MIKRRAIFLDRDGVINKKAADHHYITHWGEFEFLPKAAEAIQKLKQDFLVVVATNQPAVKKGLMGIEDLAFINSNMLAELAKRGAHIDKIYSCLHMAEEGCDCRKGKPGLLLEAARELNIDLAQSYMVGDSLTDIEAGKRAGCKTILLADQAGTGKTSVTPDFTAKDIWEAARLIL